MTFTISDFRDLLRILETHPEWRSELRRQILDEEFLKLPEYVRALDARMGRVEVGVEKLGESQERTGYRLGRVEEGVAKLNEAQERTEYRLGRVEENVGGLDQRVGSLEIKFDHLDKKFDRLEVSFAELKEGQRGLAIAVGQLQTAFGSTIEEESESVVRFVLEQKGYRMISDPFSLALNGEIDVLIEAEDPSGVRLWIVIEAKARLGYRQVRSWGQQMKSEGWQRRLVKAGIRGPYLVYAYAIRYDPGAVRAAEEEGIGLMSLNGERVIAAGVIHPSFGNETETQG